MWSGAPNPQLIIISAGITHMIARWNDWPVKTCEKTVLYGRAKFVIRSLCGILISGTFVKFACFLRCYLQQL